MRIIDFNSTKCRHCYKCVRNCEIKAISVLGGRAEIMEDHCILCGRCLAVCPQEAKTMTSELNQVRSMIRRGTLPHSLRRLIWGCCRSGRSARFALRSESSALSMFSRRRKALPR